VISVKRASEEETEADRRLASRGWRYRLGVLRLDLRNRSDKTIPGAGDCFDVTRLLRRIGKRNSQALGSGVEPAFEIDHGIIQPQTALQLFPRNDLARAFQQGHEELKGFVLETDANGSPRARVSNSKESNRMVPRRRSLRPFFTSNP
jgi:hypothetical protein